LLFSETLESWTLFQLPERRKLKKNLPLVKKIWVMQRFQGIKKYMLTFVRFFMVFPFTKGKKIQLYLFTEAERILL